MNRRILFISRNYPPKIGGLEAYSYHLIREFERRLPDASVQKIVLAKAACHLIWFLPYALIKAWLLIRRQAIGSVHLCDGLLTPLGLLLKQSTEARVSVSIHGLDIVFDHFLYQRVVPRCVGKLDRVICVSRSTREACLLRRIPSNRCEVIPNGIDPDEYRMESCRKAARYRLEKRLGSSLKGKKVLLFLGRQIKRKGVAWFVDNVSPALDDTYLHVIAGSGPEIRRIESAVRRRGLEKRAFVLGRIEEEDKKLLYHGSDIFIMPNVAIPGDLEGFGIAALEAGSCGLPVVASNIEGLRDAVIEGKTGYLVEERNAGAFVEKITRMDLDRDGVRSDVLAAYSWDQIGRRYHNALVRCPNKDPE